jgi:Polysaccharide pyruvyl transferase
MWPAHSPTRPRERNAGTNESEISFVKATKRGKSHRLPLLSMKAFSGIARLLAHKTVWYDSGVGNTGDTLIDAGTRCLFRKMHTRIVTPPHRPHFFVWGGGGNLGTMWRKCYEHRTQTFEMARKHNLPIVVLPQSATDAKEVFSPDVHIFARERYTQAIYPKSKLAPDTSLAFDEKIPGINDPTVFDVGVFLRCDLESSRQVDLSFSVGDPSMMKPMDYPGYFKLIKLFDTIITDRLHFAIASLMMGRQTILLPNSYYKNRAVYEQWLEPLGCRWGIERMWGILGSVAYDPEPIKDYICTIWDTL